MTDNGFRELLIGVFAGKIAFVHPTRWLFGGR
jgi:hypothetical protein